MTLGSILVPLDGSQFGEYALPYALGLARRAKAKLELAHAREPVSAFDVPAGSTPEEEDRRATERAQAILADAEANGIDLIALETRGRSGLARLLLGSVADKVLRGATVPVLLKRPTDG